MATGTRESHTPYDFTCCRKCRAILDSSRGICPTTVSRRQVATVSISVVRVAVFSSDLQHLPNRWRPRNFVNMMSTHCTFERTTLCSCLFRHAVTTINRRGATIRAKISPRRSNVNSQKIKVSILEQNAKFLARKNNRLYGIYGMHNLAMQQMSQPR